MKHKVTKGARSHLNIKKIKEIERLNPIEKSATANVATVMRAMRAMVLKLNVTKLIMPIMHSLFSM